MAYFLKKTKPSKKGEYLQIYESKYIPGKGCRNHSYKVIGYVSDLMDKGIKDPVKYAKDIIKKLNDESDSSVPQIGDYSSSKNVGYFLLKAMIDNLDVDNDIKLMTLRKQFKFKMSDFIRSMIYSPVVLQNN